VVAVTVGTERLVDPHHTFWFFVVLLRLAAFIGRISDSPTATLAAAAFFTIAFGLVDYVADLTMQQLRVLEEFHAGMQAAIVGLGTTYFMQDAAPHDPEVRRSLAVATGRYRNFFMVIAEHMAKLDYLRPELTLQDAADLFWFYFGYWGYYTLHNENGWAYERAEKWLSKAAQSALLKTLPSTDLNP
jgi:hypothetical protein